MSNVKNIFLQLLKGFISYAIVFQLMLTLLSQVISEYWVIPVNVTNRKKYRWKIGHDDIQKDMPREHKVTANNSSERKQSLGKDQTLILIVHNCQQQDFGEQKKDIVVFTNVFASRFICPTTFRLYLFLTILLPTNKKEHPGLYFGLPALGIYYSAPALNSCKRQT